MNAKQKIYKELFSTMKVDLSSVNDLKKSISEIKGGISAVEEIGNELAKELGNAQRTKNRLGGAVKSILSYGVFVKKQISDFNSKAKDLGLDVSSVKEIKELERLQQDIKEYQDFYNKLGKIPTF